MLKDVLARAYPAERDNFQKGILCISAEDGYRCAFIFSEIFNRNDQQELLLVKTGQRQDGGLFRLFRTADFFPDRAIKSGKEVHFGF
jgi:hypothetical protein